MNIQVNVSQFLFLVLEYCLAFLTTEQKFFFYRDWYCNKQTNNISLNKMAISFISDSFHKLLRPSWNKDVDLLPFKCTNVSQFCTLKHLLLAKRDISTFENDWEFENRNLFQI